MSNFVKHFRYIEKGTPDVVTHQMLKEFLVQLMVKYKDQLAEIQVV